MCSLWVVSLICFLVPFLAWAGDYQSGSVEVRLERHLTSYSTPAGTEFSAVVISSLEVDGRVLMPPGTRIWGKVRRAQAVGIGLRRERASLHLEFMEYELPDGSLHPLEATLVSIENAREQVKPDGKITGILAAGSPHGLLSGLWLRPNLDLLHNAPAGMTSASGMVSTRMALGPLGMAGLVGLRMLLLRLPEPEIQLTPGTEMRLAVKPLPPEAPWFAITQSAQIDPVISSHFAELSHEVNKADGRVSQDLINLGFIGTREEVARAFETAGWYRAEPLNGKSFAKTYLAIAGQKRYPTAPVSMLMYDKRVPDMVFQKSWNTLSKRHHIRIWQVGHENGGDLWAGAATHDVGIVFDRRALNFAHQIDPRVDLERAKVVNDLTFAGCAETVNYVERSGAARRPDGRPTIRTDGALALLKLQGCEPNTYSFGGEQSPRAPGGPGKMLVRRFLLESRHTILRGNLAYLTYRALRWRASNFSSIASVPE